MSIIIIITFRIAHRISGLIFVLLVAYVYTYTHVQDLRILARVLDSWYHVNIYSTRQLAASTKAAAAVLAESPAVLLPAAIEGSSDSQLTPSMEGDEVQLEPDIIEQPGEEKKEETSSSTPTPSPSTPSSSSSLLSGANDNGYYELTFTEPRLGLMLRKIDGLAVIESTQSGIGPPYKGDAIVSINGQVSK